MTEGKDEIAELITRMADPKTLAEVLSRVKQLRIQDGLPSTFVGISVSLHSLVDSTNACEKLAETQAKDPDEMWAVIRSAWGCLIDRLTDLAMDKDGNIGMTQVQWGAFVMMALYFEHKGDFAVMAKEAKAIVNKNVEIEVLKKVGPKGDTPSTIN